MSSLYIEDLETPAAIVDLDILEKNLRRLSSYAERHALALRPHTKTRKIPELAKRQIASGCSGITVAKVGEAEVMTKAGLDDVLVAYPVYGDAKLARLAEIARSKRIVVAVDSEVTIGAIDRAASHAGSRIDLLIEFDVGMHRCGVQTPEDVVRLAQFIARHTAIRFAGVELYPGHVWLRPEAQATALQQVSAKLQAVLDALSNAGFECEIVSGGSTPTAYQSHLVQGLTEIRPGTYIFNDRNTLGVGACELEDCAYRVLVTVVSTAVPGRAIVDGGSKTFSSDRWLSGETGGFGLLPEHPAIEFESMSEEHGHLAISKSPHPPKVGEKFSVIPNHVCACVNLHRKIYYHRAGIVEGYWIVEGAGRIV